MRATSCYRSDAAKAAMLAAYEEAIGLCPAAPIELVAGGGPILLG